MSAAAALAALIDYTILKPDATRADVAVFCDEARAHKFRSVCINPIHVAFVAGRLAGSDVRTCSVVGFPFGTTTPSAKAAEAAFVKTSTGFGGGGATVEDVRLMRREVGPQFSVKASGGVRTREAAEAMIEAGATRIGTSSGLAIIGAAKPQGGTY